MKPIKIAAFALNAALYVAAGVLFYSVFPVAFGPVRFWPQAVVPAVFAVIFGPWVGGLGAALGIFVNDIVLNGNPLLSLMAGVTANFAGFYLLGYLAQRKFALKFMAGICVVFVGLAGIAYVYTDLVYVGIVVLSFGIFVAFALLIRKWFAKKWQSYEVAAVAGLFVGSAIIGLMVPVYFQYFAPNPAPITLAGGLAYLIWTFTTEIPFLLVLGPPILAVVYKAFPNLMPKEEQKLREEK
jgi:hypothetical protein